MSYVHKLEIQKKLLLSKHDPSDTRGLSRDEAAAKTAVLGDELSDLQDMLYAASQNALLIVLQGRDTSGKDGAIRSLLQHCNVQSCRVVPFKVPTPLELSHDFLWRVHSHAPAHGSIAIFNRSHYEDVLVARVHDLVPKDVWKRRYDQINDFEQLLASSATTIVKFYLHISKDEQERRLLDREKSAEKAWKLAVGDWKERELWDKYTEAYEDALTKCHSDEAPWYIVPANHKWFRDLAIIECLVDTLKPFRKKWMAHLEQIGAAAKRELEEYRAQQRRRNGGAS